MQDNLTAHEISEIVRIYKPFVDGITNWQLFVKNIEPKQTGCEPVYEVDNPLQRITESVALADMRDIRWAQPHYHANGEVEIYFIVHGMGRVVVGNEIIPVKAGSVVVTPSETAHYALPDVSNGLVLIVVNTPPFNLSNNIDVSETDTNVQYDHALFTRLTRSI